MTLVRAQNEQAFRGNALKVFVRERMVWSHAIDHRCQGHVADAHQRLKRGPWAQKVNTANSTDAQSRLKRLQLGII